MNADQEKRIDVMKNQIGGGTILSDLLGNETIADYLRTDSQEAENAVEHYFENTESKFFYYALYRDGVEKVRSDTLPRTKALVTFPLATSTQKIINITLEYEK